jgi:uncharacterized protein (TIGR02145 family)
MMKTKILLLLAAMLSTAGIMAQTDTTDPGAVINGVKWATRNVDNPGTFAATPESAGKFYQWSIKIAWRADSVINNNGETSWRKSYQADNYWQKTSDPSPAGWRVPTIEEIKSLLDEEKVSNEWATQNGVNGRKFTDKATGASIFLPAAGLRNTDSKLQDLGAGGAYWSSTQSSDNFAKFLLFLDQGVLLHDFHCAFGLSVRSVAE